MESALTRLVRFMRSLRAWTMLSSLDLINTGSAAQGAHVEAYLVYRALGSDYSSYTPFLPVSPGQRRRGMCGPAADSLHGAASRWVSRLLTTAGKTVGRVKTVRLQHSVKLPESGHHENTVRVCWCEDIISLYTVVVSTAPTSAASLWLRHVLIT